MKHPESAKAFLVMTYSAQIHLTWLFFREKPHRLPPVPLHLYEKCYNRFSPSPSLCDGSGIRLPKAVSALVIAILLFCTTAFDPTRMAGAQVAGAPCSPTDWPLLSRYSGANQRVLQAGAPSPRVIFLGDSITEHWIQQRAAYFSTHGYLDRGIYGQTTPQILLRLRPDVIDLKPQVVVILAGTNDLAGNTGPETLPYIEGNLTSMVELARANRIRVILSSILPVTDAYSVRTVTRRPADILALNGWMQSFCGTGACIYLDYYSSMIDTHGLLRSDLTPDGVHPNPAGYSIMEPLAERAIHLALAHP